MNLPAIVEANEQLIKYAKLEMSAIQIMLVTLEDMRHPDKIDLAKELLQQKIRIEKYLEKIAKNVITMGNVKNAV